MLNMNKRTKEIGKKIYKNFFRCQHLFAFYFFSIAIILIYLLLKSRIFIY